MVSRISPWKVLSIILIVVLLISSVGFVAVKMSDKYHIGDKVGGFFSGDDKQVVHVSSVPSDTMVMLKEGTNMSFGDPSKPYVNLIVTPQDLNRDNPLIGDKPSPLLNAVKDKKIMLNIYIADENGQSSTGINSLIQAAACNTFRDETPGKIATLSRLIEKGNTILPEDDYKTAVDKLGIDSKVYEDCQSDQQRSNSISGSTADTERNTQYFLQHFGITHPSHIIVDGQSADRLDVFNPDWVDGAMQRKPIISLIREDVNVKSADING